VPDLDPITGHEPASLTTAQLAERLAMERALREQEHVAVREALGALKSLFDARVLSDRRALELQAAEYERRLDDLNHAHEQAVEAQAMTVPRELFDQFVKESVSSRAAALEAMGSRLEASIENVGKAASVGRQALQDKVDNNHATTAAEIEVERNARIRAEGAISVWRFIAVLLGLPGIVALLLAMVALFGHPS
jgi:hypothetical protein